MSQKKQDWSFIGRFVGTVVRLYTIITDVFKTADVGLEVIEWLIGSGRGFLEEKLHEITAEYRRLNPLPQTVDATPVPELAMDPIIRVNRWSPLTHPYDVKMVMRSELESLGPDKYDITEVVGWIHNDQNYGNAIEGHKLYAFLKEHDMLRTCVGQRDLEEIQKRGIAFFRKYFGVNRKVFGWLGVTEDINGILSVPYLYEHCDSTVLLGRKNLDEIFYSNDRALRHVR